MTKPRRLGLPCLVLALAGLASGCAAEEKPEANRANGHSSPARWPTWVLPSAASVRVPPPGVPAPRLAEAAGAERKRPASGQPATASARWTAGPATEPWIRFNLDLVSSRAIDPPLASRGYALVSVAMYDAVVAARYWEQRYRRSTRSGTASGYPSEDAAIAGAASRVLAYLFPERSARSFDRMANAAARARVLARRDSPAAVEAGLALGRKVAALVAARARRDGSARRWRGRPPTAPGHWAPPPDNPVGPVQPLAGTWRTWVLKSGAEFRPPPPPAFGSRRFRAELREVMRLRTRLTPQQKRIAKFWEGGVGTPLPPGVWNEVALAYIQRDRLDTAHSARVFALLNVAMADAAVAVWDSKYAYWSPRPENAVRELGLARAWRPFLATPPFPAYVSAHSAFSAAAGEVLSRFFPNDKAAFRAKAEEAGISRLYGGIHLRADHVAGRKMGRAIGRRVITRAQLPPR